MTLTQAAGLVGFFLGILLHLFLFSALLKRRHKSGLEIVLLCLLGTLLLWFSGSFISLLLRQMDQQRVSLLLRIVDAVTLAGLAFLPPLLLHSHWFYYRRRHLPAGWERKLVKGALVVLYLPPVALPWLLAQVFLSPPGEPLARLLNFEFPFLLLLGTAYYGAALLGLRIMAHARNRIEWTVFRGLVIVFAIIPLYNLAVFSQTQGPFSAARNWLTLGVWLASLLPSSLICYYIYRYQFLDVDTSRPLASALMILLSLSAYIGGVWLLGGYLERELKSPPLLLQVTFVAGLLLLFPTLSRWLQTLVDRLLTGEMKKYRAIGELIHQAAPIVPDPALFRDFVEEHLQQELGTSQVRIHLGEERDPNAAGDRYPLVAGDRHIGYLEIQPESDLRAERDSMRFLANEIAVGLERCESLAAQVRMERELAQKSHMEDLGRMAATVAHNVKNPLSSMKTLLQLFGESRNLTAEQREEVGMMIREVDRLSATVSNLLKFSRLESAAPGGDSTPAPPLVDLVRLVDSLRAVLQGELQSRSVRVEIGAVGGLDVKVDPEVITDILANLLLNAIEASPSESRITVALRQSDAETIIEVEDEGAGIPPHVREKLFEPFVSTKSRGTGLGLAIVKKRVEQLRGEISFVSPVRLTGTRFTLRFPAMKGSEANHDHESAHRR